MISTNKSHSNVDVYGDWYRENTMGDWYRENEKRTEKKHTQQNTNTNTEYGAIWMRLYVYVHTFYLLCYRIKIRECSRYARLADLFFIMFVFFKYLFAFISKKKNSAHSNTWVEAKKNWASSTLYLKFFFKLPWHMNVLVL